MKPVDSKDSSALAGIDGAAALDLDQTDLPQRPEAYEFASRQRSQEAVGIRLDLKPGVFKEAITISLPESLELTSSARIVITDRILEEKPEPGTSVILILDPGKQIPDLYTLRKNGIVGLFDASSEGLEELVRAVDMVAAGYVYLNQSTFREISDAVEDSDRVSREKEFAKLSRRELEVAELLAQRLSNKEIAARLHIAANTVKQHVISAREKLGNLPDRHAVGEWYRSVQG